jgi:transposase-like protein
VFLSTHRDAAAARRFFKQAITTTKVTPMEVVTDRALAYLTVLTTLWVPETRSDALSCKFARGGMGPR